MAGGGVSGLNNMILDKIIREQEQKKKAKDEKDSLKICRKCGKEMLDNTFKHGSRTGGSFDCECGYTIMF